VRYKTASNQRLLVEVSLMELVNLLEKKNPEQAAQPEVSKAQNKQSITQQPKPAQKITVEKGVLAEPKPQEIRKPEPKDIQQAPAINQPETAVQKSEDSQAKTPATALNLDEPKQESVNCNL
jgi:hypothetical protein